MRSSNKRSLITSIGVLFAPKSIYKRPLSSNTKLFSLLTASSLLMPHKIYIKSTPFIFNIVMFFSSWAVINTSWYLLQPIKTKHTFFWCTCFIRVNSFWDTNFYVLLPFYNSCSRLNRVVDKIYHLLQKQI